MTQILYKAIELDTKGVTEKGAFSGYASRFGVKDFGGDMVMPGAFAGSLEQWSKSGRTVPVLWQHDTRQPIGGWEALKEDDTGLFGDAQLWLDDAPQARLARKGMLTKTITGLSIGYRIKRGEFDTASGVYQLHELDLAEISVVTNPMLDSARVDSAKSLLDGGNLPTIREFEDFLRDAGFSKADAVIVASRGFGELLKRRDSAGEQLAVAKALEVLTSFKLN